MPVKQYEIHLADNRIFAFWGNELNIIGIFLNLHNDHFIILCLADLVL